MKIHVASNFMGTFAFDSQGKLIGMQMFKTPEDSVKDAGENKKNLLKRLSEHEIIEDEIGEKYLSNQYRAIASEKMSPKEINEFITKYHALESGKSIRKQSSDKIVMKVIGIIDEMDEVLNNLTERTREWCSVVEPDLLAIKDHQRFLEKAKKDKNIDNFGKSLLDMHESRELLAEYIDNLAKEVMPNTSVIAGTMLASRLIEKAGGLDRLAKMPSSKIQLLGAEKALFRHLRGEGKAPKYGIIFGHQMIQNAPKQNRGKVARLVASKISMASKIDRYSGNDRSRELLNDLKRKVKTLLK